MANLFVLILQFFTADFVQRLIDLDHDEFVVITPTEPSLLCLTAFLAFNKLHESFDRCEWCL
jgi:hypothetical protein